MDSSFFQKPRTRREIANFLSISPDTLKRRLAEINFELPRGLVYPHNIVKILISLGYSMPEELVDAKKNIEANKK